MLQQCGCGTPPVPTITPTLTLPSQPGGGDQGSSRPAGSLPWVPKPNIQDVAKSIKWGASDYPLGYSQGGGSSYQGSSGGGDSGGNGVQVKGASAQGSGDQGGGDGNSGGGGDSQGGHNNQGGSAGGGNSKKGGGG